MLISINSFKRHENYTLSTIDVDGVNFGYILENPITAEKIEGNSKIPSGNYKVTARDFGGFHERYSKRFKYTESLEHKGMLWIRDVQNFKYILIHIGNFTRDTDGCPLIGSNFEYSEDEAMVTNSKSAYIKFYNHVIGACIAGKLELSIK